MSSYSLPSISSTFHPVHESIDLILNQVEYDDGKRFTSSEISTLKNLKWRNGNLLITLENINYLYEICGLININGFKKTIEELDKSLNDNLDFNTIIFNSNVFNNAKNIYDSELVKLRDKIKARVGIINCPKCGGNNTQSITVRKRGGDEALTNVNTCFDCDTRWDVN